MINAVIFDMDGLLINSEPLWRISEKKVFGDLGISITDQMCDEVTGHRIDEVVSQWYQQTPWRGKNLKEVESEIVNEVMNLVSKKGNALIGVHQILEGLKKTSTKLALASSSPFALIESVLEKLEIGDYFDAICSAADEEYGKPHPAVYLSAADQLNVRCQDCLVFEDSVAGMRSANSAGMKTFVVPSPAQYHDSRFMEAYGKLRSLSEFDFIMLEI